MAAWSPTKLMSNLASSLASSLRKMPREETRDELIRSALLADDQEGDTPSKSRSESPEIPMLDSPSVFRMASRNDENCDPNSVDCERKSKNSLGRVRKKTEATTRTGIPRRKRLGPAGGISLARNNHFWRFIALTIILLFLN